MGKAQKVGTDIIYMRSILPHSPRSVQKIGQKYGLTLLTTVAMVDHPRRWLSPQTSAAVRLKPKNDLPSEIAALLSPCLTRIGFAV
jgi:hypothetical protein